mmetsp:Transcript_30641/g.52627  ORF Transcript_30641/g.52627 Transcript_30641/m.52627 type:complete len:183 (-) Transcript_30641:176-724(-)
MENVVIAESDGPEASTDQGESVVAKLGPPLPTPTQFTFDSRIQADELPSLARHSATFATMASTTNDQAACAAQGRTTMPLGEFMETHIFKARLRDDVRDGLNRGIHLDLERAEMKNDKQAFYRLVVDGWENLVLFHIDNTRGVLSFPNWEEWYDGFLLEGSAMYFKATPPGLTRAQIERFGV